MTFTHLFIGVLVFFFYISSENINYFNHVCTKYYFNYICVIILENYKFYIYVLCQPFIILFYWFLDKHLKNYKT